MLLLSVLLSLHVTSGYRTRFLFCSKQHTEQRLGATATIWMQQVGPPGAEQVAQVSILKGFSMLYQIGLTMCPWYEEKLSFPLYMLRHDRFTTYSRCFVDLASRADWCVLDSSGVMVPDAVACTLAALCSSCSRLQVKCFANAAMNSNFANLSTACFGTDCPCYSYAATAGVKQSFL